jgi:hypothetical protein
MKTFIKSLCLSFLLITGAVSAMHPAPELSQAERTKLGKKLLDAVLFGEQERAEELIAAGANVNITNQYGNTPLHLVCHKWQNEIIAQKLIVAGADVNATGQYDWTPLLLVSKYWKNEAIFQQFIAAGADVNAKHWGRTPLHYVCKKWQDKKVAAQLADLMLRTPNANQSKKLVLFLYHLKQIGIPRDIIRSYFKEPLLRVIAQENAENPESLFRTQIDQLDNTDMKQYLLKKYSNN